MYSISLDNSCSQTLCEASISKTSIKNPFLIGSLTKQTTPVTFTCQVNGLVVVAKRSCTTVVDKLSLLCPNILKTRWFSSDVKCLDAQLILNTNVVNLTQINLET